MGGFDWGQFSALFWAIRRGEEHADDGMGTRAGGGDSARLMGLLISFLMVAVMLFAGGHKLGQAGASVLSAFNLSVLALVFTSLTVGFYSAVSSLFFASDLAFYVALPVSGQAVLWAKLANFIAGAVVTDAAILPLGLGVLLGRGEGPLAWLVLVVAFALCALAVNVALVLVVLPLMRFSRIAANKDRFARVLGVVVTLLVLGVVFTVSFGGQSGETGEPDANAVAAMMEELISGPAARAILTVLCPPLALGGLVFGGQGLLPLAGIIGMAALLACYVLLLNWCAGRWYFEAVRGLAGGAGTRSTRRYDVGELAGKVRARSQLAAFVSEDMAQLMRVPYFFNQFVLSQWLMPVIIIFAVGASVVAAGSSVSFGEIREAAGLFALDSEAAVLPLALTVFLTLFSGMLSYVFAQAVGRDGRDFFYFRAMPVDLRSYVLAKFVAGELVGRVPIAVILLAGTLVIGLPLSTILACLALYVFVLAACDLVSLALGMRSPNLGWESEDELARGGDAFGRVIVSLVATVVVMALPVACVVVPLLPEIEVGVVGPVAAVAVAGAEACAAMAYVLGPALQKLAAVEP